MFLGKVRIRPSILDFNRRYEVAFPLLRPGAKKGVVSHGTIHLAVEMRTDLPSKELYKYMLRAPLPPSYYNTPEILEMVGSAQRQRIENVLNLLASQNPPIRKEVAAVVCPGIAPLPGPQERVPAGPSTPLHTPHHVLPQ